MRAASDKKSHTGLLLLEPRLVYFVLCFGGVYLTGDVVEVGRLNLMLGLYAKV